MEVAQSSDFQSSTSFDLRITAFDLLFGSGH